MTTTTGAPRALHLVDVENLCGSGHCSHTGVSSAACDYLGAVPTGPEDQFVIASSQHNAPACWFGWPTACQRVMAGTTGPDAADLALLEAICPEHIARSFSRVVLCSGDGIFTDLVSTLTALQCAVTVVARDGHLSHRLRMAATDVVLLPDLPHEEADAHAA